MIHVYTGDGKGKTTAAAGLAIRAAGGGYRVLFFQFLKCDTSSERSILGKVDNISLININCDIPFLCNADNETVEKIKKIYKNKIDEIYSLAKLYDMFVFDEAISAVDCGVLEFSDILKFKDFGEVVLTGRGDISAIADVADYITEMKKVKHPYDKGVNARKCIEY